MDVKNKKKGNFICFIRLNSDQDLFKIKYIIDGKEDYVYLSNKATYAIYLGSFSNLFIEDNPNIKIKIALYKNKYLSFYENYRLNIKKQEIIPIIKNQNKLYLDILENTGDNTYTCLKRIFNMALHYKDNKDNDLLQNIKYALSFVINNYYTGKTNYSGNWWPYEIGIPRVLTETLLLLYNDLEKEEIFKYLNIINFYAPNALYIFYRRNWPNQKYEIATYANLADNIYIALLKGIMIEDTKTLNYLFNLIKRTIIYTKKDDGFYLDGSFIQHKNIPYNASYGEVLLNSLAKLLKIFKLCNYDITNYLNIIINLIKTSYEPFLYYKYAIESVRGRAVSRKILNSNYSYKIIVKSIKTLKEISNDNYLNKLLIDLENNEYNLLVKAFNYMDRYIYRNNDYLISFNNNSAYIANYEAINGENLLGYYEANGTFDIYYNNENKKDVIRINPFYRNGSTNNLDVEEPNKIYKKNYSIGVVLDNLLNVYFKSNASYKGNFSRFVLPNSFVMVGSNIKGENLHHTIYDDYNIIKFNDIAKSGKLVIKGVEKAKLINYNEKRSYSELNIKENKNEEEIKGIRLILENVKNYSYQIYPNYKKCDDKYLLVRENNYHALEYNNYIFLNNFTNREIEYKNIRVNGRCALIFKYLDDKVIVNVSTGIRQLIGLKIEIDGYIGPRNIIINDELEHLIEYRRKNEEV